MSLALSRDCHTCNRMPSAFARAANSVRALFAGGSSVALAEPDETGCVVGPAAAALPQESVGATPLFSKARNCSSFIGGAGRMRRRCLSADYGC